jgi:hypothetical protein
MSSLNIFQSQTYNYIILILIIIIIIIIIISNEMFVYIISFTAYDIMHGKVSNISIDALILLILIN